MNKELSLPEREFIAAFFDGDGCISVAYPGPSTKRPTPRISLGQSYNSGQPPELLYIQSLFGGSIYLNTPRTSTKRDAWELLLGIDGAKKLLAIVLDHGFLKRKQAAMTLEHIEDLSSDPVKFARNLQSSHSYADCAIDSARMSIATIAGYFAAEGSLGMYKHDDRGYMKLRSSITQEGCRNLLVAIKEKLGYGWVQGGRYEISAGHSIEFLQAIVPHIPNDFQKVDQIRLALDFTERRSSSVRQKRTAEEIQEMKEVAEKLKQMKKK